MKSLLKLLSEIGAVGRLAGQTFGCMFRKRPDWRATVQQMDLAGVGSCSITVLTALFTGAVMALQFSTGLEPYGASLYTGKLVSLGIIREMGPTLTAVLVGGRVGAGFAAELGSMKVTEQVDAMRALGADPIHRLVVPRVIACMVMLPLLTVLADFVGCFGGMLATMSEVGITWRWYVSQVTDTVGVVSLMHGLYKSIFFGFFIAIIGCYMGLKTKGGTEGVGRTTTDAVVAISITVLVSNFILTKVFMVIYG
jgi:phospholipid/cholesterol/gamma-HCH transport system permease protein